MPPRDQQAILGQRAGGNRQRNRCCQRQRARASDDQHRNGNPQGLRGIDEIPADSNRQRHEKQRSDKIAGDAVGQFDDFRLFGCRPLHQANDRRQPGFLTDFLDAHDQRAFGIDRTAGHAHSGRLRYRPAFTGQQRFVGTTDAFDDPAIGRHHLARANQHHVTRTQVGDHALLGAAVDRKIGHDLGKRRQQFGQRLGHAKRFLTCRHFQIATAQQEENEHRDRVEVDLPLLCHRRPTTGQERRPNAERHRHIHADPAQLEIAPGATEKRRRGIEHHPRRQ